MITYHRKRFKGSVKPDETIKCGNEGQGPVMSGPDQHRARTIVVALRAPSSDIVIPQPKRSGRKVAPKKAVPKKAVPKKASNSATACEQPSRPSRQIRKHERAAAEQTIPNISRARRRARRSFFRNARHEGKLTDELLRIYLENLWQSMPGEKKDSNAYIDSMWFQMYHELDREKGLKWIKRKGIFSKKYVFLPICLWDHWSLVIFCHLGEDIESKTTTPCMLLLDSLHKVISKEHENIIRRFLLDIYEDEGRSESKTQINKIPLLVPKVPQQTDAKECGHYVLYYINLFLMSSPESFSISDGYPYFMSEDWFTAEEVKSFSKTLPSIDQDKGLVGDSSDGASDDVVVIE